MAGTCECSNETSVSTNAGNFVTVENLLASQEGLCSVE